MIPFLNPASLLVAVETSWSFQGQGEGTIMLVLKRDRSFFAVGTVLCTVGWVAASLAFIHEMPVALPFPNVTTRSAPLLTAPGNSILLNENRWFPETSIRIGYFLRTKILEVQLWDARV